MKVATWNIERLKHIRQLAEINRLCMRSEADILVLTEADERVAIDYPYQIATPYLNSLLGVTFNPNERAVILYSKYKLGVIYPPFCAFSSIAVELETEIGSFVLYGVIIGRFGNRHPDFMKDLRSLCNEIDHIAQSGAALCICGDFNLSFADNYYFTKAGRATLSDCFSRNNIHLITAGQTECIDHIALSASLIGNRTPSIVEWNEDKRLSDHKGIMATI